MKHAQQLILQRKNPGVQRGYHVSRSLQLKGRIIWEVIFSGFRIAMFVNFPIFQSIPQGHERQQFYF